MLVVLDVRFDRRCRANRALQLFDGNVDERERRDRLRLAVLDDLEILFLQIGDDGAGAVGGDGVDFDVVDPHCEGRLLLGGRGSGRLLTGDDDGSEKKEGDGGTPYAEQHLRLRRVG